MKKLLLGLVCCAAVSLAIGCSKTEAGKGASGTDANMTTTDKSVEDLKSRGVFVLGLDDSFPPLGFRSEEGEIVGYDIDLGKEVAKRLGVEFRAQPIDWSAKELELQTGNIDCIWNGFTMTDERREALSCTKAYLNNEQVLVVRTDSGILSLADMAGKKVGLQSGSSAQAAVDGNAEFAASVAEQVKFKDNVTALNDLATGGIDGVVMDSVVAEYSIATSGYDFIVLTDALATEEYGIGFRKGDVALCNEVQKTLEEMAADGTVAEISTKWFGKDISVIGK